MNECTPHFDLRTKRHNRLAEVVRKTVVKWVKKDLRSGIFENSGIQPAGLSQELPVLRLETVFKRRNPQPRRGDETEMMESLEFSFPSGCISHGGNPLE
jgi:hypothetical protein